jgi:hypothetical protein
MKVIKFGEFIKENIYDTSEGYVKTALSKLKVKIESYFESDTKEGDEDLIKMSDALKKGKDEEKDKSKISFSELGLSLLDSEFSKYSALNDSIKFIFSDSDNYRYDLYISIPLEEAIVKDKTKDFSYKDIKNCFIKFKKYDEELNVYPTLTKNVEIESIDDNFLANLKIEYDEEFGDGGEKLEIEVE